MAGKTQTMTMSETSARNPAAGSDHPGLALMVISAAQLMLILDATIVNVALPAIQRALHFSTANLVWVSTGYAVTYGGLLLFGGRTGDLFGRRRMFMIGIAIFATSSLLGGLALNSAWLIITRACQGIGASIASPTALSLIATNFAEGEPRNKAMGVYATVSAAGGGLGLLAGGLLVDLVSWRWVLFVNVPIAIAVLIVAPMVLREGDSSRGRLDVPGALTATAGMALLVFGLTNSASHGWESTGTIVSLAVAAVLLVTFVLIERRTANALMPLHIFASRDRSGTYLTMFCLGAVLLSLFFFVTLYFQDVLHYSPLRTGLYYLPFEVAIAVAAQGSSRLVARFGARVLIPVGTALAGVGLWWLSTTIRAGSSYLHVLGPILVIGFGMGIDFVPLTLTALAGVRSYETGLASALLNAGQQVGGAVGLSALSTIAVSMSRARLHELAALHRGVINTHIMAVAESYGFAHAYLAGAGIALVALIIALAFIRVGRYVSPSMGEATAGAMANEPMNQ